MPSSPKPPGRDSPSDVGADVPMEPLPADEAMGVYTPGSMQRRQVREGTAMLQPGDSGPAVAELQRDLRALELLAEDLDDEEARYGPLTGEAVRRFQATQGLREADGCDAQTRARLREAARGR